MSDEPCTNCGALRSAHTPNVTRGGLDCPPRADGKVPVVIGHRVVGMDHDNHCAVTVPEIEWRDPPKEQP